jgi:hypothetical protein
VQVGSGSASGIITLDSETLGLDNWEFEVAGRVELQTGAEYVRMDRMGDL